MRVDLHIVTDKGILYQEAWETRDASSLPIPSKGDRLFVGDQQCEIQDRIFTFIHDRGTSSLDVTLHVQIVAKKP
jgi:hypothetical protein